MKKKKGERAFGLVRSNAVLLLADSSKFENPSFVTYAGLKDVDAIVSDERFAPDRRSEYESAGVSGACSRRRLRWPGWNGFLFDAGHEHQAGSGRPSDKFR